MTKPTFAQRCLLAEQVLPDAPYRAMLKKLHDEMLEALERKPLTDEQFLELILRTGTVELVGTTTFVGGSIQMQGKIGLLRSAKIIKEFVEAAHGIKGDA